MVGGGEGWCKVVHWMLKLAKDDFLILRESLQFRGYSTTDTVNTTFVFWKGSTCFFFSNKHKKYTFILYNKTYNYIIFFEMSTLQVVCTNKCTIITDLLKCTRVQNTWNKGALKNKNFYLLFFLFLRTLHLLYCITFIFQRLFLFLLF